jgi:hypothetical protein
MAESMRCVSNSNTVIATAKRADLGSDEYVRRVAMPIMAAIDDMPSAYRDLVNEFGYVDVYRAWRADWQPGQIRHEAECNGGLFVL